MQSLKNIALQYYSINIFKLLRENYLDSGYAGLSIDELVKSKNWDGKVPVFRLFKIKASGTGAFGDNPVYEVCGAYGTKRSSGKG